MTSSPSVSSLSLASPDPDLVSPWASPEARLPGSEVPLFGPEARPSRAKSCADRQIGESRAELRRTHGPTSAPTPGPISAVGVDAGVAGVAGAAAAAASAARVVMARVVAT